MKHCDRLRTDYKHGKGLSERLKDASLCINTCNLPMANVLIGSPRYRQLSYKGMSPERQQEIWRDSHAGGKRRMA
jgi:predicted Fe-S protein YdhL (DUF1289 family)